MLTGTVCFAFLPKVDLKKAILIVKMTYCLRYSSGHFHDVFKHLYSTFPAVYEVEPSYPCAKVLAKLSERVWKLWRWVTRIYVHVYIPCFTSLLHPKCFILNMRFSHFQLRSKTYNINAWRFKIWNILKKCPRFCRGLTLFCLTRSLHGSWKLTEGFAYYNLPLVSKWIWKYLRSAKYVIAQRGDFFLKSLGK